MSNVVVDYVIPSDLPGLCIAQAETQADCCGTSYDRSREDELREELRQKDEEIKHLKSVANALADDMKFERMVKDVLLKDCAAAVELADSLKKKIEYCKKNGIWTEEDES